MTMENIANLSDFIYIALALAGSGVLAGLLAGMFGIGGGVVVVPILYYMADKIGFSGPYEMHTIMATSLAMIVFTALAGALSHIKYKEVSWSLAKFWAPVMFVGAIFGTYLNSLAKPEVLTVIFAIFCLAIAVNMFFKSGKSAPIKRHLSKLWHFVAGFGIGTFSAMMGIGGGTLSVPTLSFLGTPMKIATGTSAFLTSIVALAGTIGYMWAGYGLPDLPPHHIGFVDWGALLFIVPASIFSAPLGAKISHRLPARTLARLFAVMLLLSSTKMILDVW